MSYVHGYSEREAERLRDQSTILEELLHRDSAYPGGTKVLEAGCGIGAQTVILAKNSPDARFYSIDIAKQSLDKARAAIKKSNITNVQFRQASVFDLPYDDEFFDSIFVCFLLEHLDRPEEALIELKRVLKTGGSITVIEGDHGSCFWHPQTKDSRKVWNALITAQQRLGHDPLIGRKIYPLLKNAGFNVLDVSPRYVYGDMGKQKLLEGMVHQIIVPMVRSSKKQILDEKIVDSGTWNRGISDLSSSGTPPDGTFFYTWFKGIAVKE
ncbi:methyltransferase domain-containing protein [candidate division KSB1 bacterium]|nr:methyltransferase domain-containing protein [candidate division KSB1 bacterium]